MKIRNKYMLEAVACLMIKQKKKSSSIQAISCFKYADQQKKILWRIQLFKLQEDKSSIINTSYYTLAEQTWGFLLSLGTNVGKKRTFMLQFQIFRKLSQDPVATAMPSSVTPRQLTRLSCPANTPRRIWQLLLSVQGKTPHFTSFMSYCSNGN